jgi:glycosyltransferase involved in cell wall biosynthesis
VRILFTRFPLESALGGAERQTLAVMQGLRAAGHQVEFMGSCPVLLAEVAKLNMPVHRLDIGVPPVTKFGAVSFAWRQITMRKKLVDTVTLLQAKQPHIDAVVMLSISEKLLLTDWCQARQTKVYWWEHDRIGRWLRSNPWLPALRALASCATTITVSDLSRSLYIALGWPSSRTIAIPNGVNPERFGASVAALKPIQADTLRVGCIARLSAEKGVDVLIQAVANLPWVSLHIVGSGPEEGYIHKLVGSIADAEHQTISRIVVQSQVPDVGAFYRSLDVLVLPSRDHDPFGLVVAEAMQLGIPVVVTNQCGIAAYIRPNTEALVVPADDVLALVAALRSLQGVELRTQLAVQGQLHALRVFDEKTMIQAYVSLLGSVGQ